MCLFPSHDEDLKSPQRNIDSLSVWERSEQMEYNVRQYEVTYYEKKVKVNYYLNRERLKMLVTKRSGEFEYIN